MILFALKNLNSFIFINKSICNIIKNMNLSDFDFALPQELIAQEPLQNRSSSKLLRLKISTGDISNHTFEDLKGILGPQDVLVFNNTRVLPARLLGNKLGSNGRAEALLLKPLPGGLWEALVKPAKRLKPGHTIKFAEDFLGEIVDRTDDGTRIIKFNHSGDFWKKLHQYGKVPLPPYIKSPLPNPDRYQTVYSQPMGAVAAPTAGLHFTPEMLEQLKDKVAGICFITLHIGIGTFRLVKTENVTEHTMDAEHYIISSQTANTINQAIDNGKRIVAIGTTVVRTLEAAADAQGKIQAGDNWTSIFIYPGYQFKVVKALITNFHLPKSTLLLLISAFAGRENVFKAYQTAIENRYRFYSFGDAMLIED